MKFEARVIGVYDSQALSDATGLKCKDPSRASQEFKEEVDINTIARRYGLTGELPAGVPMVMQGDFTEAPDFRSAMDLVVKARESFDAMPAEVRARFRNDPVEFVEFTSKRENFEEAVKFGLVRPEVAQAVAEKAAAARKAEVAAMAEQMLKERQKASEEAVEVSPRKGRKDQSST